LIFNDETQNKLNCHWWVTARNAAAEAWCLTAQDWSFDAKTELDPGADSLMQRERSI
jgi:hypothetical protein